MLERHSTIELHLQSHQFRHSMYREYFMLSFVAISPPPPIHILSSHPAFEGFQNKGLEFSPFISWILPGPWTLGCGSTSPPLTWLLSTNPRPQVHIGPYIPVLDPSYWPDSGFLLHSCTPRGAFNFLVQLDGKIIIIMMIIINNGLARYLSG